MIKAVMEQWDDKRMEHFDDKSPGSLCCQGSRSILMTVVMEHCDEKSWSIGLKLFMEYCDDRCHLAL